MKKYGLIFDMDNTILDTHIDFAEMQRLIDLTSWVRTYMFIQAIILDGGLMTIFTKQ